MDCWLDERNMKKPPCDPSKRSPRFDCNETSTSDQNVSMTSYCGDIDSRNDTLEIICIFGWLIASVFVVFSFGLIVYIKIKFHKQNKEKMADRAISVAVVETSVPASSEETEYVSAEYLDLDYIPPGNNISPREYQHLQFTGTDAVLTNYEQLVDEPSNTDDLYLVPITQRSAT